MCALRRCHLGAEVAITNVVSPDGGCHHFDYTIPLHFAHSQTQIVCCFGCRTGAVRQLTVSCGGRFPRRTQRRGQTAAVCATNVTSLSLTCW